MIVYTMLNNLVECVKSLHTVAISEAFHLFGWKSQFKIPSQYKNQNYPYSSIIRNRYYHTVEL